MIILNLYVFLWIALTFFTLLISVSKINSYRAVLKRDAVAREPSDNNFDVETSFYRADATWHEIVFFHASASGLAAILLVLVMKGRLLFPETVTFFGILAPIAIFIISIVLLLLAFYFFTISMVKLGTTLGKLQIKGEEVDTKYAIAAIFGYFLIFAIIIIVLA
ncbi:hypothetical protein [uncultured Psychrobacter sp.]|uniref:hypothetical protein n=1 Tax=uncultured Psychrobacter sp. TaxID=259303 RepID=UPI0034580F75